MAKQRYFANIRLNFAAEVRTAQSGNVLFRQFENFWVIDEDFTDVRAQVITKRTNDNVTFLMNQEGCWAAFCGFLDGIPMLKAEGQVPLQGFCGFTDAGSTHNQAHAIRQLQRR